MKYTCKQCGKEFEITDGEAEFFRSKGMQLPKRCKECRAENKKAKQGNNTSTPASTPTPKASCNNSNDGGFKLNQKMVKMIVSILVVFLCLITGITTLPDLVKNLKSNDESYSAEAAYSSASSEYDSGEDTETVTEQTAEVKTTKETTTEATTTAKETTKATTKATTQTTTKATTQTTTKATTKATTQATTSSGVVRGHSYYSKNEVAEYIHKFGVLPPNFITKAQARELGWNGGSVEVYAPGKAIGGDRYGNYEGLLPAANGRVYYECDINTNGKSSRGAERIIYSNDGLIYYTSDHYESFTRLY